MPKRFGGGGIVDVRVAGWTLSPWKRLFDALLAGTGLLLSLPLWLAISVAILLEDGWPVLYTQERVGLGGRVFRLYKFRSMVRDAERLTGAVLAGADDPRVTRV
ncbi:MAG: sugar transferase, partial [Firmicutes bacterium]|nr:sugar transferase [Bacillota bacterium]